MSARLLNTATRMGLEKDLTGFPEGQRYAARRPLPAFASLRMELWILARASAETSHMPTVN